LAEKRPAVTETKSPAVAKGLVATEKGFREQHKRPQGPGKGPGGGKGPGSQEKAYKARGKELSTVTETRLSQDRGWPIVMGKIGSSQERSVSRKRQRKNSRKGKRNGAIAPPGSLRGPVASCERHRKCQQMARPYGRVLRWKVFRWQERIPREEVLRGFQKTQGTLQGTPGKPTFQGKGSSWAQVPRRGRRLCGCWGWG